ncbi:MAG: hypothetical protein ACR2OB_12270 [Solirubrobacteraceae bacterium]
MLSGLVVLRRLRPPRWLKWGVDAAAVVLVALLVIDVAAYLPYLPFDPHDVRVIGGKFTNSLNDLLPLVHQDFYLAPVNDLLHGRVPLVDAYSQYGVGVLYLLAAFFKVAPLGYGPSRCWPAGSPRSSTPRRTRS